MPKQVMKAKPNTSKSIETIMTYCCEIMGSLFILPVTILLFFMFFYNLETECLLIGT